MNMDSGTAIIQINATAFIESLALKMRSLFEGGVYSREAFIATPTVTGKSKREIGPVVLARFAAVTTELRIAKVLERES